MMKFGKKVKEIIALAMAVTMTAAFTGCGSSPATGGASGSSSVTATSTSGTETKSSSKTSGKAASVAMALPGLITDEAFNQFTYEGMKKAADEEGIKCVYKENVSQDEQVEVLRQFAQAGYSIVIGDGGQFGEALAQVAKEYPDTHFVFLVGTDTYDMPNLTAATIDYGEAGFIGGVLSGLSTTNKKAAYILGEFYDTHKQMEAGFKKGLEYVDPSIEETSVTTGDWADTVKAREASLALISQGYDVLFPCLDAAGGGVAAAAQDSKGEKIVGSVADYAKDYGAENVTVGSVVYAWDQLGYLAAKGELNDGKSHVIGLADGGITPVINAKLTDDQQKIYDQAMQDLKDGKIEIKVSDK